MRDYNPSLRLFIVPNNYTETQDQKNSNSVTNIILINLSTAHSQIPALGIKKTNSEKIEVPITTCGNRGVNGTNGAENRAKVTWKKGLIFILVVRTTTL